MDLIYRIENDLILADVKVEDKKFSEAEIHLNRAILNLNQISGISFEAKLAKAYKKNSIVLEKLGKYTKAINHANEALVIYQKRGDRESYTFMLRILSGVYAKLKRKKYSQKLLKKAGIEFFEIGKKYLNEFNHSKSEEYLLFASEIFMELASDDPSFNTKLKKCLESRINNKLHYFNDLVVIANYYYFSLNQGEAKKFARRALIYSLDLITLIVERHSHFEKKENHLLSADPLLASIVLTILSKFDICNTVIKAQTKEMNAPVGLKLSELGSFYKSLINGEPLEISKIEYSIKIHKESLKYIYPIGFPQFIIFTSDGRLIHYYNRFHISAEGENKRETEYLIAGLLTAIHTMFSEVPTIGKGTVEEVNTATGTLLLESRENIVVVAICTEALEEIRIFVNSLADQIHNNFNAAIKKWLGDKSQIKVIEHFINEKIEEFEF